MSHACLHVHPNNFQCSLLTRRWDVPPLGRNNIAFTTSRQDTSLWDFPTRKTKFCCKDFLLPETRFPSSNDGISPTGKPMRIQLYCRDFPLSEIWIRSLDFPHLETKHAGIVVGQAPTWILHVEPSWSQSKPSKGTFKFKRVITRQDPNNTLISKKSYCFYYELFL